MTQNATPDLGIFDVELALRQARTYLAFADQVRTVTDHLGQAAADHDDWGTALQQHFAQLKIALAQSAENPQLNPELAKMWMLTADTWQSAATALGVAVDQTPGSFPQTAAWSAYQQTQSAYFAQLRGAALRALDLMEQRLAQTEAITINSLRDLYDLWVECNEETYGEMLRSTEYAQLNGALFNALLRCCVPTEQPEKPAC